MSSSSSDSEDDRDVRTLRYASAKGVGRIVHEPITPGGHRNMAWGGSLGRVTHIHTGPFRDDERTLRPGFGAYYSPNVDPSLFNYVFASGWRVAIPQNTSVATAAAILNAIKVSGPAAAGYVRLGSTLVPAHLEPGDRLALAEHAD